MRKFILGIIGVVIIACSIFGARYLVKSNVKQVPEKQNIAKPVTVQAVKNEDVVVRLTTNGSLTALNKFELFSEVQGVFMPLAKQFRPGQEFKKNEVLVTINNEEFLANLKSSKSQFINSLVSIMPDVRLDYPSHYETWQNYLSGLRVDKNLPALPKIEDEAFSYFINGRGILSSYYAIKNLEIRLEKFTIRAPFNGVLTQADITPGTLVRTGQRLGEFINPEIMELEIALQKGFVNYVHVGDTVSLQGLNNSIRAEGIISRINKQVDPTSQTVRVFVQTQGENLTEGMYLEALIMGETIEDAFQLNRSLINNSSEVFVVKDSVLALKKVKPLHYEGNLAIVKGLENGDVIMTSNLSSAYSGMLVSYTKN